MLVLLDVDVADAKGCFGLALRGLEAFDSSPGARMTRIPRPPPPATALMMTGSQGPGNLLRRGLAVDRAVAAGQDRHAGLLHRAAGAGLVAEQRMTFGVGPMNLMWQASQTSAR